MTSQSDDAEFAAIVAANGLYGSRLYANAGRKHMTDDPRLTALALVRAAISADQTATNALLPTDGDNGEARAVAIETARIAAALAQLARKTVDGQPGTWDPVDHALRAVQMILNLPDPDDDTGSKS